MVMIFCDWNVAEETILFVFFFFCFFSSKHDISAREPDFLYRFFETKDLFSIFQFRRAEKWTENSPFYRIFMKIYYHNFSFNIKTTLMTLDTFWWTIWFRRSLFIKIRHFNATNSSQFVCFYVKVNKIN